MRECPECGYKDPPCWRHKRHRLLTDYCYIDELEVWQPEIAKIVKEKKDVKIGHYIYHLTRSNYVDRIHIIDSADGKTWHEPDYEGRKPFRFRFVPLGQKRLFPNGDRKK